MIVAIEKRAKQEIDGRLQSVFTRKSLLPFFVDTHGTRRRTQCASKNSPLGRCQGGGCERSSEKGSQKRIREFLAGSGIRDPGSGIRDPGFGIRDPGFGIRDPRSGSARIRDPGFRIREDPGSGIQDPPGSARIREFDQTGVFKNVFQDR